MTNTNKKEIKKWVKVWKKAGSALEEIRQNELRLYDYKKNQDIVNEMLQYACDNGKIRLSSGLVTQQQIFMKSTKKEVTV